MESAEKHQNYCQDTRIFKLMPSIVGFRLRRNFDWWYNDVECCFENCGQNPLGQLQVTEVHFHQQNIYTQNSFETLKLIRLPHKWAVENQKTVAFAEQ
jgi:hypothetical protein